MAYYRTLVGSSLEFDWSRTCYVHDSVDGDYVGFGRCVGTFENNFTFNFPVQIGDQVTDCSGMFSNCTNFNQPITIPDSVTNCSSMFFNCT